MNFNVEKINTIEDELRHNYELNISDKFWSLLEQRLGIEPIPNPGYLKIRFNSPLQKVNEKTDIEVEDINPEKDIIVQGVLDYNSMIIHFNIDLTDVDQDSLAEVIAHELIHYAQIQGEKYKQMKPPFKNDKNLLWEKEAYRLMHPLAKQLLKEFDLQKIN